ncbi:D-alanyl-D-alanine carboxypeptidase/D-alanyl-D-alanine endopeptidase [Novosphingobium terrae]|uniref:D-alanyl-D-alanine carboxypeptidase/D-alanyl-D-alanine endopeptidase n=1 Tax=Novosphingobium terrae TaxID=2726189 RepID=UPI0019811719|nr:D-alanyl-D-alanine carboxypeptidase/D-alanyl-D-alanine-endopeptidase [Novosphingobium terrae]
MPILKTAALWLTLALPMPLAAATPADLESQIRALLAKPDLAGTRWGLRVEDKTGHVIVSIAPDDRFQPASNTKVFVTSAAFDVLAQGKLANPGTQVRLEPGAKGLQNVVLVGKGDASLSDRADCTRDCLSQLADAVAASGVKRVGDVIGDDSFMPDERWVRSGRIRPGSHTIMSALTLNDNTISITVSPGAAQGSAASAAMPDLAPEVALIDEVTTAAPGTAAEVHAEIAPGQRAIRLFGSLPVGGKPQTLHFDVDDPADFAAIRFARLLRARGITVSGSVKPRHAPLTAEGILATAPAAPDVPALASLTPPDPIEDLTLTAKLSQNLHAHLWLKKLALSQGLAPSTPAGLTVLNATLDRAGLPRWSHDFYDGSGLSPDNRITPRAMVAYLHWIDGQNWAPQWRATLPIAGVDGTLAGRMKNTPLAGNLRAKTGTLLAANALAGYVTAASGKELVFAFYANDRPGDAPSVLPVMDRVMQVVAAGN